MRCLHGVALRLAAFALAVGSAASLQAAVMTSGVRVTSGIPPYKISYFLAQDVSSMTINIRNASTNAIAQTITGIPASALLKGSHVQEVSFPGTLPAGPYYAEVVTSGAAVSALSLLQGPTAFGPNGDKTDVRGSYGGDVNKNPASPYHNTGYFAATATNENGGAGVEAVEADASSRLFPLPEGAATGAYDYVSATVLGDDSILTGGQTLDRLVNVSPVNGSILGIYAAGKVDTRTVRGFGSGAAARVYFVDDNIEGVSLLDPLTAANYVNIVPGSALPNLARGLDVKKDESALYVCGNGFIKKFNKPATGTTWTEDTGFVATAPAGNMRGLVLSPDESTVWVSNNSTSSTAKALNRVFGLNATTGAALDPTKYQFVFNAADVVTLTPQGIAVSAGGNVFVAGFNQAATGTTENSIAILAPPDAGSTDTTRGTLFYATNDTNVEITNVKATNLTFHSATIEWDTNVPADSTITGGPFSGSIDMTVTGDTEPNTVVHHALTVDGLEQGTQYFFTASSAATGFTTATSSEVSFTTPTLTISDVQAVPGDISAVVKWTTNFPATSIVSYGVNQGSPDQTYTDTTLVTQHEALLRGLQPSTTYYYSVESGYTTTPPAHTFGDEKSFTTLASVKVLSENLTATVNSAALTLTTSSAVATTAKFGTSPTALTSTATAPSGTTNTINFASLAPGTTYYYSLEMGNPGVATLTTPVSSFTTEVGGGIVTTVTHSTPEDLGVSERVNLDLGAAGNLLKLQRQGLPGAAVETTALPQERYYHGVAVSNGYLYVIGGRNNLAADNTVDTVFVAKINTDGTVGAWSETTKLPAPRLAFGEMTFGYNGYIYVVGGAGADFSSLNTVLYAKQNTDGTLGTWQNANPFPLALGKDLGSVITVDGYVLLSGGEDNAASPSTDPTQYVAAIKADGSLGEWHATTDLPSTRWFNRTRQNNHLVYSFGGYNSQVWVDHAQIGTMMPFGALTPLVADDDAMDTLRYNFAAALTNGKLLTVAGRISPNTPVADISYSKILADGTTGAWTMSSNKAPFAVDAPDGKAFNGRIYEVGGRQNFAGGADANAVSSVSVITMDPDTADPDGSTYAYSGTLDSPVIDLASMTNLRHLAVAASGGDVEVRYRFAGENALFSDWFTLSGASADITGGARYVQYQLVLKGAGTATPTVNSITLTTGANAVVALPGDVNKNGVANEREDVLLALKIMGGLLSASDPSVSFENANVAGGTTIDMADVVAISRHGNGL